MAELVSGGFETSVTENSQPENPIAVPSKSPRVQPENLEEIETSLRKEILSDLAKISKGNDETCRTDSQKSSVHQNAQDSDSRN